jgi:hypothetical protein
MELTANSPMEQTARIAALCPPQLIGIPLDLGARMGRKPDCALKVGQVGGWLAALALVVVGGIPGCAEDEPIKPIKKEAGQFFEAGPGDSRPTDRGPVTCSVDFPCFDKKTRCNGATKYYKVQTVPCEKYCGDANCSGASCDPVGPEMECPPGT